jgi:hypothetical protein
MCVLRGVLILADLFISDTDKVAANRNLSASPVHPVQGCNGERDYFRYLIQIYEAFQGKSSSFYFILKSFPFMTIWIFYFETLLELWIIGTSGIELRSNAFLLHDR